MFTDVISWYTVTWFKVNKTNIICLTVNSASRREATSLLFATTQWLSIIISFKYYRVIINNSNGTWLAEDRTRSEPSHYKLNSINPRNREQRREHKSLMCAVNGSLNTNASRYGPRAPHTGPRSGVLTRRFSELSWRARTRARARPRTATVW